MEPKPQTYRVVGVNGDNSRIILDEGLSPGRAEQMKRRLLEAKAFPRVEIETAEPVVVPTGYNPGETAR